MLNQEQIIEIFNETVGCQYKYSTEFQDYLQNVDTGSTKKEAKQFAKILKELIDEDF